MKCAWLLSGFFGGELSSDSLSSGELSGDSLSSGELFGDSLSGDSLSSGDLSVHQRNLSHEQICSSFTWH